jgi:hypothetical protein
VSVTEAHFQTLVLAERLRLWYPAHAPRAEDPHYALFNAAKRKARALDVPCWRCGVRRRDLNRRPLAAASAANPLGAYQLELHHQELEFSLSNAVDVEHWWQASTEDVSNAFAHVYSDLAGFLAHHPELDPRNHRDVFDAYVESEGNLQVLCDRCHRSNDQGVHHIPYPEWRPMAVWRHGLPAHVQAAG